MIDTTLPESGADLKKPRRPQFRHRRHAEG